MTKKSQNFKKKSDNRLKRSLLFLSVPLLIEISEQTNSAKRTSQN